VSERWNGIEVFHELHLVYGIVSFGVVWILCSIGEPKRRPWWLLALVGVALVALVVHAVLTLRTVTPVEPR
jgi:hypothetical protein